MPWKRVLALNLTIGLVACLLVVVLRQPDRAELPRLFGGSLATVFCVATPIMFLFTYYGRRIYRHRAPLNWILVAATILGCTIFGNLVVKLVAVWTGFLPPDRLWPAMWTHTWFSAILATIFGAGALGYQTLRSDLQSARLELRSRQLEQERADKLAVEAQLASLESHVRPHFLFNTLNTISSLIPDDPKLAESLIGKLAVLLRLSLDANQLRVATLERELKIAGDYLEIERARYGERLRYTIDVPAQLRTIEIPCLALQTVVENSVKYAAGERFEGAEIRIAARLEERTLVIEISDDGPGFTADAVRPGHGLDNVRRRLAALFGPAARLEIAAEAGARVSLRIPRSEAGEATPAA